MHLFLPVFFRTSHGGLHDHVQAQVQALRRAGHQSTILCPPGTFAQNLEGPATRVLTDSFEDVPAAVRKALTAGPFDLVHAHPFQSRMVGHGVARTLGLPLVLTLHGLYLDGLNAYGDDVDLVVAVSGAIRDFVVSEQAMPAERVVVLHNGVNREIYRPHGSRQESETPCIVLATRLDEDKRFLLDLVKETWRLCSERGAVTWRWLVAGDGGLLDEMRSAARLLDADQGQPAVEFLGWQEDAQLAELYRTADAVIGPGRCALDAMACGAPTIALGSRGYIGPVDADRLYRAVYGNFGGQATTGFGDAGGVMFDDLLRVLQDHGYSAHLGELGTTVVDELFDQDRLDDDLMGLYHVVSLVGSRASRTAVAQNTRTPTALEQAHAEFQREREHARTEFEREREAALAESQRERAVLQGAIAQLEQRFERAKEERYEAERELTMLRSTAALRLAGKVWTALNAALPQGSRRRRAYQRLRSRGQQAAMEVAVSTSVAVQRRHDVVADLLDFESRIRRAKARTVAVLLCGTQLIESEGQRPTQFALALASQGIPVVFAYWRWGPEEWAPQDRLDESILQVPIDMVIERPGLLVDAFVGLRRLAVFEFPYPGFFELLANLNAAGWTTVYDVLDDWQEFHRVGQAKWYDAAFEGHLITGVDAVTAVNDVLADRVRVMGGEMVEVVGNGLKPSVAISAITRPLERGELTIGYFGHLTGAWFDWRLVVEVARRRPTWKMYLIGYGGEPDGLELPPNIELLGRKPQHELAAYAANWDVGMIPFKAERLAAGADPIKTYEYLAMGLPVVVTGVYPPPGGEEFVVRVEGADGFLAAVQQGAELSAADADRRREFASTCTWDLRVSSLLNTVSRRGQRVAQKDRLFSSAEDTG